MGKKRKRKTDPPPFTKVPLRPSEAPGASSVADDEKPIIKEKWWGDLPLWFVLHAERGPRRKCWCGHRMFNVPQDGRTFKRCEVRGCGVRPPAGSPVMACKKCRWMVCQDCCARQRLPTLETDPLFHGPKSPCVLVPSRNGPSTVGTAGTVIICPGGNYEFLSPLEGQPVVDWLAASGIASVVLRYRLLPAFSLEDSLDDLEAAVRQVRETRSGPVAAIGFSAGGHLIASLGLRGNGKQVLDHQCLIYPAVVVRKDDCDFHNRTGRKGFPAKAHALLRGNEALLGGPGFGAPPTFLVASTADYCCAPKDHTDPYARALKERQIPVKYLKRDFGDHGFGLEGGWTDSCVKWLKANGFGKPLPKEMTSPSTSTSSSASTSTSTSP